MCLCRHVLSVWSELEEHKTVSSQQTEEIRTTIFRQLIRLQRKVVMLVMQEFTVLLSYTQQMDKSGLPLAPIIANKFWTDKTKTCSNSPLTFPWAASGAFASYVSLLSLVTETGIQRLPSLSLTYTHLSPMNSICLFIYHLDLSILSIFSKFIFDI